MTTNGAEAFYWRFTGQFYHPRPRVFRVIDVIKSIQVETDLKLKSSIKIIINDYCRKEMVSSVNYANDLWIMYSNSEIDQL